MKRRNRNFQPMPINHEYGHDQQQFAYVFLNWLSRNILRVEEEVDNW